MIMEHNYLVVVFKNKTKKKIINKFQTLKRATGCYDELIKESNSVLFDKSFENGVHSKYEIAIVVKKTGQTESIYIKDDIGRQKKVELEDDDYTILKISDYKVPDKILDLSNNKRITCEEFIKKYLPKNSMSMVSSLNNKIVVQNDDTINLFTLKTTSDASRLIDFLFGHFLSQKRNEALFVKDVSTAQRKYLYKLLEERGFSKSYLQRHSTTHVSKR